MSNLLRITAEDILEMDRISRLNLVNSITGFKPANLIATRSDKGVDNVAVFSSIVHLGSNPALIGHVTRPVTVPRHTYANIKALGEYTINHIPVGIEEAAHWTSANFPEELSEFEECGLTAGFAEGFKAPFVKESPVVLLMEFQEEIPLPNGTMLIIGKVKSILMKEDYRLENGSIDLHKAGTLTISGLDTYHPVSEGRSFPYAKFESQEDKNNQAKKRPDQVVYDEKSETYNASLLPYATNVGAPVIKPNDLTHWKASGAHKITRHLQAKYEELKTEYEEMTELFKWNELVYKAKFSFEPIAGETYHLYRREEGELFLSMIPPDNWAKECLGSFKLSSNQIWQKV
jgi:flavin reductase (DIM6/NTAB) family NADH-FMN oxidoreductase RutF